MNRPLASSLLLAAFAFASAACGGSSTSLNGPSSGGADASGGGDGSSPPSNDDAGTLPGDSGASDSAPLGDGSASQACADWAAARCHRFDACSDGLYVQIHFGDESACEAAGVQTCTIGLAAKGTSQTPGSFEACAAALPGESCSDFLGANPVAACAPQAGSLANGAACVGSAQCQSTYCAVPLDGTCGACAAVPQAGDKCAVAADCGERGSLTCTGGLCGVLGAMSASCSPAAPCDIGLDCVGAKKTQAGTCMTAANTVGATCDPTRATATSCDATLNLSCDPATKKCVQDTVVSGTGTCGEVGGGVVAKCSTSGTCAIPTTDAGTNDAGDDAGIDAGPAPTMGTCVAAAATGSACDTAMGPGCLPPAKCVVAGDAGTAGTCQVADPTTCQ